MIYIASDHAGFELKKAIIEYLEAKGDKVEDCGPLEFDPQDDYPDFIAPCAQKVAGNPGSLGIILGMSGNGEQICANKVKGIRAALYYGGDLSIIKLSREHNNANVLSLGAKFLTIEQVKEAIDLWLGTAFSNDERHIRRLKKISQLEK